jgi:outer membrane protein
MKTNLLSLLILGLGLVSGAAAQTPTPPASRPASPAKPPAATGTVPNAKIAVINFAAFQDGITELKQKYDKLRAEFALKINELESMKTKLDAQEKLLNDPDANAKRTPQQTRKLQENYEQLKKEYQRAGEDYQDIVRKREEAETGAIYDKIFKFMETYTQQRGITLVLELNKLRELGFVVYLAVGADITEDFMKEYNKANPSAALKNP